MRSNDHILFFVPGFAKDEADYYCIPPFQGFLQSIREMHPEISVTIIAIHYPYQERNYFWNGFPVFTIGGKNNKFPMRIFTWRKVLKKAEDIHLQHPVTIVHSLWLNESSFLAQRFSKKHNLPHFATIQGQDALASNRYLSKMKLNSIKTIAISERCASAFNSSSGKKTDAIIPWGLDKMGMNRNLFSHRDIDILGVGSLIPVKNYGLFLDIIAEMVKEQPDLKAVLVGEGPEENKLKMWAKKNGLKNNLIFTGLLGRPDVLKIMERSKVFLHTSDFEGQGYVFLEAIAAGMKIVSTAVGMASEGENWTTLEKVPQQVEEMKAACKDFLMNPFVFQSQPMINSTETVEEIFRFYELNKG